MTRSQYADDELGEHALVDVEEQHVVTVFDPPDDIVRWTLRIYLNNNDCKATCGRHNVVLGTSSSQIESAIIVPI